MNTSDFDETITTSSTIPVKYIDYTKDYTAFSKLTSTQQRKILRRMEQTIPLAKMTYEQAKLFHRLKGRIK